jgi:YD repeat-containing protein
MVSTNYDESNCLGLASCQNVGQRTGTTDTSGSESWSYHVDNTNTDTTKRSVHVNQRTTSGVTKTSTYYLDQAGNLARVIDPTSRTVNYTLDNAHRPSSAVDGSNGITYGSGPDRSQIDMRISSERKPTI